MKKILFAALYVFVVSNSVFAVQPSMQGEAKQSFILLDGDMPATIADQAKNIINGSPELVTQLNAEISSLRRQLHDMKFVADTKLGAKDLPAQHDASSSSLMNQFVQLEQAKLMKKSFEELMKKDEKKSESWIQWAYRYTKEVLADSFKGCEALPKWVLSNTVFLVASYAVLRKIPIVGWFAEGGKDALFELLRQAAA